MNATETQNAERRFEPRLPVESRVPIAKAITLWPIRRHLQRARLARFFAVVVQFGLIVLVVEYWQIESQALTRLMWLSLVGFIVHHLLPQRYRLSFFAGLSIVAVITAVGHLGPNVIAG